MRIAKIRRVGNSNVISIPRGLESFGFRAGETVMLVPTKSGELILVPADRLDQHIDEVGRRVLEENREALEILAAHDRDEASSTIVEKALERDAQPV